MSSKFELDPLLAEGSGTWFNRPAGEAVGNRACVRLGTNGNIYNADASILTLLPAIGITMHSAAVGENVRVLLKGFISTPGEAWTPGAAIYVSTTGGSMTHTAPTNRNQVAIAITATQIWFDAQCIDTT